MSNASNFWSGCSEQILHHFDPVKITWFNYNTTTSHMHSIFCVAELCWLKMLSFRWTETNNRHPTHFLLDNRINWRKALTQSVFIFKPNKKKSVLLIRTSRNYIDESFKNTLMTAKCIIKSDIKREREKKSTRI